MRKILKIIFFAAATAILLICGVYLAVFGGWKDLIAGRMHRIAQENFLKAVDFDNPQVRPWNITEARIYLLAGEPSAKISGPFLTSSGLSSEVNYGSLILKDKQLAEFLKVFGYQEASPIFLTMCKPHPAYAFQLFEGSTLQFETAMCWECGLFYLDYAPMGQAWYPFNGSSRQAKALLNYCDQRLPYKR